MSNKIFLCTSIRQIGTRKAYLVTISRSFTRQRHTVRFEGFTRQEVIQRLRSDYSCIVPSHVANPPREKSNTCTTADL